jgi:hypothetical protein
VPGTEIVRVLACHVSSLGSGAGSVGVPGSGAGSSVGSGSGPGSGLGSVPGSVPGGVAGGVVGSPGSVGFGSTGG